MPGLPDNRRRGAAEAKKCREDTADSMQAMPKVEKDEGERFRQNGIVQ